MTTANSDLRSAALQVLKVEAYRYRKQPFKLSSGLLSHDYVDMRRGLARGKNLTLVAQAIIEMLLPKLMVTSLTEVCIGGMTMGADPLAHALAVLFDTRWFSVRKKAKDHGAQNLIEGAELNSTSKVIVLEDVVSSATSLIDAIGVVRSTGAEILASTAILDRGAMGKKLLAEMKIPYFPLFTYDDFNIAPIT